VGLTQENSLTPDSVSARKRSKSGDGWRRIARGLGIDMRPGEERIALLLFLCFFLFITFQYATKSVRNSSFIDELGAQNMPWAYLGVAVFSYPFLRIYSGFADRMARHRLMIGTSIIIALSLLFCYWIFQYSWPWMPYVLYVWISIAYVMNVSQFWSLSNHVLDPRQAKRLFGFIGAGGLLGGVAGGQVSRIVSAVEDTRTVFLVAAAIIMAAAFLIYMVHRLRPTAAEPVGGSAGLAKLKEARGGFQVIKQSKQLQWIAALMLLTVVVAVMVDQQFNWAAEQAAKGLEDLTAFFGNMYSVMGISAFLFQLIFTSRIHRILGVGVAMRILPVTMGIGTGALFVTAALFPPALLVWPAVALKIGENGLRYSLDQATRELLFLPVPSKARLKAKAYIDVFVQRGAKGVAAILLLPFAFGLVSAVQIGWISLVLIGVWLVVIAATYREYVRSFREGMKKRSVDTEIPINLSDVTTLEILIQSLGSTDSRQVLHSLEILGRNGKGHLVPPLLLYHDDAQVRRETLGILADVKRHDAAGLVERRLRDEDPDVRAEAIRVLAGLQGRDVCDLMLPRLTEADPGIRAAAVACLANHCAPEIVDNSADVLGDLLSDGSPEVRAEAAKALGAISEPRFQAQLVQLLYDPDPVVVRRAIAAVRRRVARDGYNPIYVSTLISLLQRRRVKHETREALVAFGAQAVPILAHFMDDPQETLWVRRALPKTLARIATIEATQALMDCLGRPADRFLRKKLIESLGSLPAAMRNKLDDTKVHQQIAAEARRYLKALADLHSLGLEKKARLEGPLVKWDRDTIEPDLVDKLVAEQLEDHFNNLFGLLAIIFAPKDIWAAHRSLNSGRRALRTHALEYLDNTLAGDTKRNILAVIDDAPLDEKLLRARRLFGVSKQSRVHTLAEKLDAEMNGDGDAHLMIMAALYTVYTDRISTLYPRVEKLAAGETHPLVEETAIWVVRRLDLNADRSARADSEFRRGSGI
jgi:AAA family ATP:ADP antiporter